jgi:serine/threonine-protein kinase 11
MIYETVDELLILRHATKIDVWSSGVTLYQLTTGQLPFEGQTIRQIYELIRSPAHTIKMPAFMDRNLAQLLNGMLERDPVKRLTLKQIRDSEWFRKKHRVVHDELAKLPADVTQNELARFRMIGSLEKYCQAKLEDSNQHDLIIQHQQQQQIHQQSSPPISNNNTLHSQQTQPATGPSAAATLQPTTLTFSQKAKRNHCILM